MTNVKSIRRLADADYMQLIERFPLRPLRSVADFKAASALLDEYVGREGLSEGQTDYVQTLIRLVEEYEREALRDRFKTMKPLEVVRYLMEQNGMTTTDLGYVLGSRGLASEVLNGKRGLSKRLIARLAERFAVEPSVFLHVSE